MRIVSKTQRITDASSYTPRFDYDQLAKGIGPARALIARRHAKLIRAQIKSLVNETTIAPTVLLDVGSGNGNSITLACKELGIGVVCLDLSLEMLKQAESKFQGNVIIHLLNSLAEALPISSHTQSLILMNSVIHHIRQPILAFGEALRVLHPGGVLGIRTLSHKQIHDHHLTRIFPKISSLNVARYPSINDLVASLQEVGFDQVIVSSKSFVEKVPVAEYRDPIVMRYGSILHLLDQTEFEDGIHKLLDRIQLLRSSTLPICFSYTFITAKTRVG